MNEIHGHENVNELHEGESKNENYETHGVETTYEICKRCMLLYGVANIRCMELKI